MRLAAFADGTWNKVEDGTGTNVVKLHQAAVNDAARGQVTFYDEGVGNSGFDKLRGGLFGVGLSNNIQDAYRFLVTEWTKHPGEHEIFLFGFSRGAYTVRSLAGLLGRIGLVRDAVDIPRAYDLYRNAMSNDPRDVAEREKFQAEKVRAAPRIRMIGVWDTVGALGIPLSKVNEWLNPFPHRFHDTSLGKHIDAAYHAVAIDERRVAYTPALWDPPEPGSATILEQIFFPGVHSDVGGGYRDDPRLGNVTLRWMADCALSRGMLIDESRIPDGDTVNAFGRIHEPMKWVPVRRRPRAINEGVAVARHCFERRKAPRDKYVPSPYNPPNIHPDEQRYRVVF